MKEFRDYKISEMEVFILRMRKLSLRIALHYVSMQGEVSSLTGTQPCWHPGLGLVASRPVRRIFLLF